MYMYMYVDKALQQVCMDKHVFSTLARRKTSLPAHKTYKQPESRETPSKSPPRCTHIHVYLSVKESRESY